MHPSYPTQFTGENRLQSSRNQLPCTMPPKAVDWGHGGTPMPAVLTSPCGASPASSVPTSCTSTASWPTASWVTICRETPTQPQQDPKDRSQGSVTDLFQLLEGAGAARCLQLEGQDTAQQWSHLRLAQRLQLPAQRLCQLQGLLQVLVPAPPGCAPAMGWGQSGGHRAALVWERRGGMELSVGASRLVGAGVPKLGRSWGGDTWDAGGSCWGCPSLMRLGIWVGRGAPHLHGGALQMTRLAAVGIPRLDLNSPSDPAAPRGRDAPTSPTRSPHCKRGAKLPKRSSLSLPNAVPQPAPQPPGPAPLTPRTAAGTARSAARRGPARTAPHRRRTRRRPAPPARHP